MTASNQIKGLLAGVAAVAMIGTAMAQGNPPNPAVKNAPSGAGQQSTQGTPMGTTGTPAGSPSTNMGSTNTNMGSTNMGSTNMGSTSPAGTTGSGSSMGASSMSADTSMTASSRGTKRNMRMARADRN